MWFKLAQFILRQRLLIILLLGLITVMFGYFAVTNVKVDNRYGTMLPKDSQPKKDYELLKKAFGGNESLLIFAIDNENLYDKDHFNAWYEFGAEVDAFDAVDSVFSEAHLYELQKDTDLEKFVFDKIVKEKPTSQKDVDSLKIEIRKNPFYKGILYNKEDNSSLMMAFISEEIMADMKTANVLFDVEAVKTKYEEILGPIRVSGMPHIRVMVGQKLKVELGLFIALSILVTSILLFIFFRSLKIVLICNVVVFFGVIWSLGSIGAMDFQLSILMVLIPPLIIVISIPNCIFLINRFHKEIIDHGNRALALSRVIQKIGNATFLTNLTTALGFSTFIFTNSERLSEFGIIASINILCVFLLSITILPIIWSYSSVPKSKHLKHLQKKWLHLAVEKLEYLSLYKRKWIYIGASIVITLAVIGTLRIKATGNITGDLPQNDPITTDLNYIQDHFGGSIPFDIVIDTKKPSVFFQRLDEIDSLQKILSEFTVFSKSLSAADGVKILNMAYSNNNPDKFEIPSLNKMQRLAPYIENSTSTTGTNGFLDSTQQLTRISLQIRDIGSFEIQSLVDSLRPIALNIINPKKSFWDTTVSQIYKGGGDEVISELYDHSPEIRNQVQKMMATGDEELLTEFQMDDGLIYDYHSKVGFNDSLKKAVELNTWDIKYTGVAYVAANGTQYLVTNLFVSLGIAIVVIGILMSFLFRSWRMVLVSLLPNFIPLLFTAGTMGFLGIPIKPSTLLVFSIAFGISVDDTIHFLAKFRQELKSHEHDLRRCILVALRETGTSMIYTSIVLFFGFMVFAFSQFGGTKALGILVSLTLAVAMFTNLLILPTLLLWMDKKISNKAIAEPLFHLYDEEEDIEFEDLEIEKTLEKYKEEDSKNQGND